MEPAVAPSRLGSYVLLRRLGRGGMAEVFFAARTGAAGFQRPVVVKRMLDAIRADPAFVRMFVNEAKVAARLSHPNIVQVYELADADGELFIAMEFIHGKNLGNVIDAHLKQHHSPLPPEAAVFIAREICRGLVHAHKHTLADGTPTPIVHRDVSPHNVMIGFDGAVKVVDFGIAKPVPEIGDTTLTGELKGKVAYMAPEQIEGLRPGPASDQWALAVVLHELLTGKRLFKAATEWDTAVRVKTAEIPPPSTVASGVPAELDALVMRALSRDPRARFVDVAALQHALDGWLGARFDGERMAEIMTGLFGPEERAAPDVTGMVLAAGELVAEKSASRTEVVRGGRSVVIVGLVLALVAFGLVVGVGVTVRRLRHRAVPATVAPTVTTAPATRTVVAPPPLSEPAPAVTESSSKSKSKSTASGHRQRKVPVFEDTHVKAVDE